MPSALPRPLLILAILLSLGSGAAAASPPACDIEPAPDAHPAPDVTSSLPGQSGIPGQSALLDFVASVTIRGTERFSAADNFQEHQPPGQLQISWLGQNFRQNFLGKIEGHVSAGELDIYRLRRSAHDANIIASLGRQLETTLYDVWTLLNCQPQGEQGALLTDATPNIFYVRGSTGVIWSVDAVWSGAGWEIGASSLDDPRPWRFGRQIISRRP